MCVFIRLGQCNFPAKLHPSYPFDLILTVNKQYLFLSRINSSYVIICSNIKKLLCNLQAQQLALIFKTTIEKVNSGKIC